jgi:hypothetical protein
MQEILVLKDHRGQHKPWNESSEIYQVSARGISVEDTAQRPAASFALKSGPSVRKAKTDSLCHRGHDVPFPFYILKTNLNFKKYISFP